MKLYLILRESFKLLVNPLFISLYVSFIIFNSGTYLSFMPDTYKNLIYLISFLSTTILPLAIIILFISFGDYSKKIDISLTDNKKFYIQTICSVFFILCFIFSLRLPQVIRIYSAFLLTGSAICLFSALFKRLWNISIRMIGLGSLMGFVMLYSFIFEVYNISHFIIILLSSGICASILVYEKKYTLFQVGFSFLNAALICMVLLNIFIRI